MKSLNQIEQQTRKNLAAERDHAVERLKAAIEQNRAIADAYQNMQKDMVRWVMAFMLMQNSLSITVSPGMLAKTAGYVLRRSNNVEDDTITWDMVTTEQHEAEQAEKAAAEEAVKLALVEAGEEAQPEPEDEVEPEVAED